MNLVDVLMAGLVFSIGAGSSLQIWSLVSVGVLQQEQRQQQADRLEEELAALEAVLRLQSRRTTPIAAGELPQRCQVAAAALHTWLVSRPLGAGVERRLTMLPDGEGVLLELAHTAGTWQRQRLYHPAAHGLCPPAAPRPAEPGGESHA
ncbi:MAG: hypothetical protein ACKOXO_09880 [Cyanobium sp.]